MCPLSIPIILIMRKILITGITMFWTFGFLAVSNARASDGDANPQVSPIVRLVDDHLVTSSGKPHLRSKRFIGLCILADWCPASRSFARHVSDFHELFGNEVTLVLINPGKRSDWFFVRYPIRWTTIRPKGIAPLLELLEISHAPKFILMDENGKLYDRSNWKNR